MLLTQPVRRTDIFWAEYIGLSISLSSAYIIGVIIPLAFYGFSKVIFYLAIEGIFLSFIFTAIALAVSILFNEKVKGIGLLLFIWLYFSVLYDGIILMLYFMFNDYPLEKVTILSTFLNPIDISRILIILNLDISALLGYSGAVFQKFFSNFAGIASSFVSLIIWIIIPLIISIKKFKNKNF
jgi:Cu-processing system permease protein